MMIVDADRRVKKANGAAVKLASRSKDEMIGMVGGEALRCLNSLEKPEGCGYGSNCKECEVRQAVQDTLDDKRNREMLNAWVPFPSGDEVEERCLQVSTAFFRLNQQDRVLVCVQDITDQKRAAAEHEKLQEQLQQAQKMGAIGTLAGGSAHDFNNILSAVMGYSEMVQMELSRESNAGRYIEQVLHASNRAKDLVKQILAFSRHSDDDMKPMKAGGLLKEAVKLLRASLPSTIEMKTDISTSRDTILANATQIHQVIMNLCTNAFHAMQDSGGVLDVSLSEVGVDGGSNPEDRHLSPGRYLLLVVSDTGHGMSPEIVERIFDPYFTTKEKDVGTGLGLSVVHGIVKRHGGDVRVW